MANIVSSLMPLVTKPVDEQDGYRITNPWFRYLQDLAPAYGTWTPVDASGDGLAFTGVTGTWTQIGRLLIVQATLTYPVIVSATAAAIGGFPFTSGPTSRATAKAQSTAAVGVQVLIGTSVVVATLNNALGGAALTNTQMSAAQLIFTLTYETV